MQSRFRYTFEQNWLHFPLAPWVHVPVAGESDQFEPAAPRPISHKGYAVLRVEYGQHEFAFSSPEQLQHFIEILSKKPLPTSRQLSALRAQNVGPNGHWLSRLPAELKSPAARNLLVRHMQAVQAMVLGNSRKKSTKLEADTRWPGLKTD